MAITLIFFALFFGLEAPIYILPPDVVIANLLRKTFLSCSVIAASLFLATALVMYLGVRRLKPVMAVMLPVAVIIGIIGSLSVSVTMVDGELQTTNVNALLASLSFYVYPFCCLMVAFYIFWQVYKQIGEDEVTKKRIRLILIGITSILIGIIYFVVKEYIFPSGSMGDLPTIFGHVFYIAGDIFIFVSFK